MQRKELSQASVYWTLGRLGARAPWYGSAHSVISPEQARVWLEPLLQGEAARAEQAPFAIAQLARYTADRARDLDPELRDRAAQVLERIPNTEPWRKLVREGASSAPAKPDAFLGSRCQRGCG